MRYIAHKREDGETQLLLDHETNVSRLAAGFAAPFFAQKDAALAGLYHDAGKYSAAAQRRMNDPEHTAKVDHSTAGTQITAPFSTPAAFAIAGHHAGLPDMGTRASLPDDPELLGRVKKKLSGSLAYDACWNELPHIRAEDRPFAPGWFSPREVFSPAFYVRMLYSCLVDADYLDTEAFMKAPEKIPRGQGEPMERLYARFQTFIQKFSGPPGSELNRLRGRIRECCFEAGTKASGVYTLTVPTGGGKTLASMAYALEHAVRYRKKRIIYVVPYTSIIEQNAQVYRDIFGDENVLEHHSNALFWQQEDAGSERAALSAENWDAPVIVTTAVQFFESLFSCRPGRCRKLHNIADSIVIFDEAQMLPLPYLIPCVAAISELVRHYGVDSVLCTATQPALNGLFEQYAKQKPVEICDPEIPRNPVFQRACYRVETEPMEEEELACRMQEREQILAIVNRRAAAQKVFDRLPADGSAFHLSTNMTPRHRKRSIAEIRERLRTGQSCRVVSTSLIEAGVDVDFPAAYREMAGLDSILQAGGRCNREGKRDPAQSIVTVFRFRQNPPRQFQQPISATERVLLHGLELSSPEAVYQYFSFLMDIRGQKQLDEHAIMDLSHQFAFRQVDENFHLIDSDTVSVYIPCEDNGEDLRLLRLGCEDRKLMRRLGQDAVNVYVPAYEKLLQAGSLEITPNGYAVLSDAELYDPDKGLCLDRSGV